MKTLKTILAAVLLLAWQLLPAQEIILSTDHIDGRYAKGEEIKVYAKVKTEGEALSATLRVTVNGKKVVKDQSVELTAEKQEIWSGACEDASIINVFTSATGDFKDAKNYQKMGLVVGSEDFKPGFDEPEDFMEFWQAQVEKMRKKKIKAKMTQVELEGKLAKYADKVNAFDLKINMPEGNPVSAYIALPADAKKGAHAIIVLPHGAGVRTSNLGNAVSWASKGAIAIDINAHGIPNGMDKEYYKELNNGELKGYSKEEISTRENFYFRLMYLRLQRLLDYVTTLPEWDGKRIVAFGSSQGGGQSAAIAGLDKRVTMAVLKVPALSDLGGKLAGHTGGWPTAYSKTIKDPENVAARNVLPYFDAANFLHHTNARLIVEAGLIDTTCAPAAVIATFNSAASTDKTLYTYPFRNHNEKKMTKEQHKEWEKLINTPRYKEVKGYIRVDAE